MKSTIKQLGLLLSIVRPFGLAPRNLDGLLIKKWYLATWAILIVVLICNYALWWAIANKLYSTRSQFELVLLGMVSGSGVVFFLCNIIRSSYGTTLTHLFVLESVYNQVIDYDTKFIWLDNIIIPVIFCCINAGRIIFRAVVSGVSPKAQIIMSLSIWIPNITTFIGDMYFCNLLQIYRKQFKILRQNARKVNRAHTVEIFSIVLHNCNALHRSFRFMVVCGIWKCTVLIIWHSINAHERLVAFLTEKQDIIPFIASLIGFLFAIIEISNITRSCDSVHQEVEGFLSETFLSRLNKENTSDKTIQIYLLSRPSYNRSIGGFFDAHVGLIITIVSSATVYYLLMVQMGVIESRVDASDIF